VLPPNTALHGEATLYLCLATLAQRLAPFHVLALTLGESQRELPATHPPRAANLSLRVSRGLQRVAGQLPWHTTCLERAVAAKWMLRRRRVPTTLYLGVRRAGPALVAHAWLRSGPAIVTGGAEESATYPPIAWFS
jgi:hypothetical protein